MKSTLAVLLALAVFAPSLAQAASCNSCKDLPRLEKELFEQEFLQQQFRKYANYEKTPTPNASERAEFTHPEIAAMQREVTASFNAWLHSPAGGGRSTAKGGAAWGTSPVDCGLVIFVKDKDGNQVVERDKDGTKIPKTIPFDAAAEKQYRADNCGPITDYLLAHEAVHQKSCREAVDIFGDTRLHAADDVRAYGAGIRNLRTYIRHLAESCGWEGSSNETKEDFAGNKEDVVPTMKQAQTLAKTLGGAK